MLRSPENIGWYLPAAIGGSIRDSRLELNPSEKYHFLWYKMLTNAYERIVDIQLLFPSDIFNHHLAFIDVRIEAPRQTSTFADVIF